MAKVFSSTKWDKRKERYTYKIRPILRHHNMFTFIASTANIQNLQIMQNYSPATNYSDTNIQHLHQQSTSAWRSNDTTTTHIHIKPHAITIHSTPHTHIPHSPT